MTQLLALSFDCPTSPSIRLRGVERAAVEGDAAWGWGVAWYPSGGRAAMVIKDPTSIGTNALTHVLSDWERFSSSLFVGHLRGAAKRTSQQDTHPFTRSFAGRDWLLAHNGDLRHGFRDALPIPEDGCFQPVGTTDSEWILCWLLACARKIGARRLAEVGWDRMTLWLRQVNALGTLNVVLADGDDLFAYSDAFGYNPLWAVRHVPPNPLIHVHGEDLELKLGSSSDETRTCVVVATRALSDGPWAPLPAGTSLVARRGHILFRSDGLPDGWADLAAAASQGNSNPAAGSLFPTAVPDTREEHANSATAASTIVADGGTGTSHADPPGPSSEAPAEHHDAATDERGAGAPQEPPSAQESDAGPNRPVEGAEASGSSVEPGTAGVEATLRNAARILHAPEVLEFGRARELGEHQHDLELTSRTLRTVHETIYTYDEPVRRSAHLFRLRPVHDRWQQVISCSVELEPEGAPREFEDVFGNQSMEVDFSRPYTRLRIRCASTVRLIGHHRPKLRAVHQRQRIPLTWMPWQRQMMMPYLLPMELPESQLRELSDYAMSFVERQDFDLVETLKDINQTIHRDYAYRPASTGLETTPFDVYSQRQGVCQDFANLFIALARLLNIPARYRVGYIHTGNRYDNPEQGDASHAWVEVYLPGIGWRGFDPTNGCTVGRDHIRVACGRNYRDATPTTGVIYRGGGHERLHVRVTVTDLAEETASREPSAAPQQGPASPAPQGPPERDHGPL